MANQSEHKKDKIEFDSEGFLKDLTLWSEALAKTMALNEGITISPAHMEVIYLLRESYHKHKVPLANRPFVKLVKNHLGSDKGNSIYLLTLFPESPAKICAKISGLPKPANCL